MQLGAGLEEPFAVGGELRVDGGDGSNSLLSFAALRVGRDFRVSNQAVGSTQIHGLLTVGRSIPEAFVLMYYLDKACEIQARALAVGPGPGLRLPAREVCEEAARRHWAAFKDEPFGQLDWDALVRRLDVEDPSYRI